MRSARRTVYPFETRLSQHPHYLSIASETLGARSRTIRNHLQALQSAHRLIASVRTDVRRSPAGEDHYSVPKLFLRCQSIPFWLAAIMKVRRARNSDARRSTSIDYRIRQISIGFPVLNDSISNSIDIILCCNLKISFSKSLAASCCSLMRSLSLVSRIPACISRSI